MKLADWLKDTGTTQGWLAERLGVSQGRVSQLASGAPPSLELAVKIARITGNRVSVADLSPGNDGDMTIMDGDGGNVFDDVERAIEAVRQGELVVVVDDDDRENEGDLIGAASKVSPEQMAFIIRHTSGIVCAPVTQDIARRLKLDPMVATNDAPLGTAFTVSVDYREGLTTGISAKERAACVHALANANVQADDFVRPGHVFPLIAKRGGVLMRSGHTEAGVDLARLAGEPPVGVLAELVNDDGSVKYGQQVVDFARQHDLRIISVADLIAYRQARERLVERQAAFAVDTPAGPAQAIAYTTPFDPVQHLAVVIGEVSRADEVAVRLHREDLVEDVFGDRATLMKVYDVFRRSGGGVLVYLREGTAGVPAGSLSGDGERETTDSARARDQAWRDVGLGAQILRDLGISSIRLLASSSRHYIGLSGFGIDIAETVLLED